MAWSVLLCLIKYKIVSLLITDRSEIVGWTFGSNFKVIAISKHLRKPKKTKMDMEHGVKSAGGIEGLLTSAKSMNTFGEDV